MWVYIGKSVFIHKFLWSGPKKISISQAPHGVILSITKQHEPNVQVLENENEKKSKLNDAFKKSHSASDAPFHFSTMH